MLPTDVRILLKGLSAEDGDNVALRFCSILVLALSRAEVDYGGKISSTGVTFPSTPPSLTRNAREHLGLNSLNHVPSQSPLKNKKAYVPEAKKRKYNAYVEEVSQSDQGCQSQ
jgi:hypothetical protein